MKLLFLSSLYPPETKGGGEISTHLIAQGLVQRGHEIHVLCQGEQETTEELDGVRVRRLPLPFTAKPLFERRHARKLAMGIEPYIRGFIEKNTSPLPSPILGEGAASRTDDWLVHAHDFRMTQVIAELIELGVVPKERAITTVRDYAQICGSPNNLLVDGSACDDCHSILNVMRNKAVVEAPLIRKPFRIWQYRYSINYRLSSFRAVPRHVYISNAQRDRIASIQDLQEIETTIIYNPVATEYLEEPLVEGVKNTLLYVGTIDSYKGVGLLLEAFKELAAENPDVQLKLVGEGALKSHYERLVEQWGLQYRITFAGRQPWDRLRKTYDEASVLVAPHLWLEPFGRTVVEAMARGKIVVAADAGGPGEVIKDGVMGLLFESGSSDALLEKMREALKLDSYQQREIGRAAHEWVKGHLMVDGIAKQYERVYRV